MKDNIKEIVASQTTFDARRDLIPALTEVSKKVGKAIVDFKLIEEGDWRRCAMGTHAPNCF